MRYLHLVALTFMISIGMSAYSQDCPIAGAFNAVQGDGIGAIQLSWTAPGDDGSEGTSTAVDIRYSIFPIDTLNWVDATQVVDELPPDSAGTDQCYEITGLNQGETYFFAIKCVDEADNWSALSNVAVNTVEYDVQVDDFAPVFLVIEDYDGDGKMDIGILDKSGNGTLSIDYSSNSFHSIDESYQWYGTTSGIWSCPADYNGDGVGDYAQLDRDYKHGTFQINYGHDGLANGFTENRDWYGTSYQIIPCPADYNGDGIDDYAQLDKTTKGGLWQINYGPNFASGFTESYPWYGSGSSILPCPADYDGDGRADLATLYRSGTGVLRVNYSADGYKRGYNAQFPWYGTGDIIPCPADYNGDGVDDYAQHDRETGHFKINYGPNLKNGFEEILPWYGADQYTFIHGKDMDGDGKADIVSIDQRTRKVAINYASNGFVTGYDIFYYYPNTQPVPKVAQDALVVSKEVVLQQNYPNPFNPTTTITYSLASTSHVSLDIYNILGQSVDVLVNEYQSAGEYSVSWNASKYSSGVYIYRLIRDDEVETKKMLLLK